jgi:hypothetical protein
MPTSLLAADKWGLVRNEERRAIEACNPIKVAKSVEQTMQEVFNAHVVAGM